MNRYKGIVVVDGSRKLVTIKATDWQSAEARVTGIMNSRHGRDGWTYEVKPLVVARNV